MLSSLLSQLIIFLAQALALKLSVSALATTKTQTNSYGLALKLSAGFAVLSFLLGLFMLKIIAWPLYIAIWCAVIMKSYGLSFPRSIGVAIGQSLLGWFLGWLIFKVLGMQAAMFAS